MTLTSPALTAVQQRRLEAMRSDLQVAYKECGPRFLTRHPTYGKRFFVIAADDTILDREMCSKRGKVRRSALNETLNEDELDKLIVELRKEGYNHIKQWERGGSDAEGYWIMFRTEFYPDNTK